MNDSTFVGHEPCPHCGSSDAVGVFTDGHKYCFACESYAHGNAQASRRRTINRNLITEWDYQDLKSRRLNEATCRKFEYGVAKYKGGIGRKVTGKTKRWFKPNLQQLKVVEANGHVHRAWVCTKCIKSGRVMKAPHQKQLAEIRAEKAAVKAKK